MGLHTRLDGIGGSVMTDSDQRSQGIRITVGQKDADLITYDHRGLQAAVDYVAGLGGGVVEIGPGEYLMKNSLHLRSGVSIMGHGHKTVLRKCDGCSSPLFLDGDHGEEQVTLVNPSGFEVGMGVSVLDDRSEGFHTSVATIIRRVKDSFLIDRPLVADHLVAANARASNAFPVISGYYIRDVRIENLAIDGNKDNNYMITGCRGAGIYLYEGKNVRIHGCLVRNFNGDGISYQKSDDVHVIECIVKDNAMLGIHPGSGSQRTIVQRCQMLENGRDGLFICWRVKQGLFESNEICSNGLAGISIGHKDTDNLIRQNQVCNNGVCGILFRKELPQMGAHRNRIEENLIRDNGCLEEGYGIKIESDVEDVVIARNAISYSELASDQQRFGIYSSSSKAVVLLDNQFDPTLKQFGVFQEK